MIEIRHVNMVYPNGVRALNDINLNIDRNEFVFVVGASGAGKSTLIRLLVWNFHLRPERLRYLAELTRLRRREIPATGEVSSCFSGFRLLETAVFMTMAFVMQVVAHGRGTSAGGAGSIGSSWPA